MKTIRIESSREELISRLPALFPYIEWDNSGNVALHVATDSRYGCYGKVVENMQVPPEVKLTWFVPVDFESIPTYYRWTNLNTIGLYDDVDSAFAVNGSSYLRKVTGYSYEETEQNGEAVEVDELPMYVGIDAPEWVKTPRLDIGGDAIYCNGNILYEYFHKVGSYDYYKRSDIIKPCTTYSYRTLISCYYRYKDIVGSNNSFIKFMENGIGKIKVNKVALNLGEDADMVPEYVYLSTIRELIDKYKKMKKAKVHYEEFFLANGKTDKELAKISKTYVRMGGDNITNWLLQLSGKLDEVANQYLCYAENRDTSVSTSYPLMLSGSTNEIGVYEVIPNIYMAGKRYYHGDLITYDGNTYVCQLDKWVEGGDNYEYVIIDGDLYYVTENGSTNVQDNLTVLDNNTPIPNTQGDNKEFLQQNGSYYRWDGHSYKRIYVVSYICGVFDTETETYVFDEQHFVLLSSTNGYEEWYDEENLDGNKLTFFRKLDFLPSYYISDYVSYNGDIFEWGENGYVAADGEYFMVTENVGSKLRDLRTFTQYVNINGEQQQPDMNEDWLYFYKVGTICGLSVANDRYGNIATDDGTYPSVNEICYNLQAYGNLITSITYDDSEDKITFNYVIGGHLIAKVVEVTTDEDGFPKILFDEFQYDEDGGDGVLFTETYKCSDDSILNLYHSGMFNGYVNGSMLELAINEYKCFPFKTYPVETEDGTEYIPSEGTMRNVADFDIMHANTVKRDWMNGILYQPKLKSELSITRGNGTSFERHIRLGEIKTMEDMTESHYFSISAE